MKATTPTFRTYKQLGEDYSISRQTIYKYTLDPTFPKDAIIKRGGRMVRFNAEVFHAWLSGEVVQ